MVLYMSVPGIPAFHGRELWGLDQHILSGHYHVPCFKSFKCEELLKKLMTLNLSDRGTLEELMRDPWLNMGQEEELRPQESPCDNMDPRVTEVMMNLRSRAQ